MKRTRNNITFHCPAHVSKIIQVKQKPIRNERKKLATTSITYVLFRVYDIYLNTVKCHTKQSYNVIDRAIYISTLEWKQFFSLEFSFWCKCIFAVVYEWVKLMHCYIYALCILFISFFLSNRFFTCVYILCVVHVEI